MKINRTIQIGSSIYSGKIDEVSVCPICKRAISPYELAFSNYKAETEKNYFSVMYLCKSCYQTFISLYQIALHANKTFTSTFIYCEPNRFERHQFDQALEELSPQFVEIYNQALASESYRLNEIAGLGYRKAAEFLIKDFSIHLHPENQEQILKAPISACIKSYIDNEQIKILAERVAWLGNDEAHYVKKIKDRDIEDLKAFLDATVYFISALLKVEDALTIKGVR